LLQLPSSSRGRVCRKIAYLLDGAPPRHKFPKKMTQPKSVPKCSKDPHSKMPTFCLIDQSGLGAGAQTLRVGPGKVVAQTRGICTLAN